MPTAPVVPPADMRGARSDAPRRGGQRRHRRPCRRRRRLGFPTAGPLWREVFRRGDADGRYLPPPGLRLSLAMAGGGLAGGIAAGGRPTLPLIGAYSLCG